MRLSFVPHDMSTLIDLLGGPSTFISRLDYLFASGLSDVSNEISFLTAFLYHYVGRPGLSAQRIRSYFPSRFNASPSGLPGNDDSGAMSAFVAFVMSGLFPNAGQDAYLIIPPFFQEISYKTPGGDGNATIRCTNFELASNGTQKVYIRSTRLNGEDYTRNWIGHEFFSQGMTLEITLGTAESDWGTKAEDLPPSSAVGSMSI